MSLAPFDTSTFVSVLRKLCDAPDTQLDARLRQDVAAFLAVKPAPSAADLWTYCLWLVDQCARYGAGSSFVLTLLDVERFYREPEGELPGKPWRKDERATWRNDYKVSSR